ncbi:MAG: GNAT family N-acyltransferase [Fibrobacteria bacterium]
MKTSSFGNLAMAQSAPETMDPEAPAFVGTDFQSAASREVPIAVRDYPGHTASLPSLFLESGEFVLRFAQDARDLDAVCKLRFEVYNLELNEGLSASYRTHRDIDEFDPQCHHLMVLHKRSGSMAGTYRIQTGSMAMQRLGFYSAQEFDISVFPREFLERCVEVGRACIGREYRNGRVLQLLWKGLARYLDWNGKLYLFGCCSLTSQDPAEGRALFRRLAALDHLHPTLFATAKPGYECDAGVLAVLEAEQPRLPRLFEGYLNLGGLVCGEPALDRRFKTIDYPVMVDIQKIPQGLYRKMLA